MQPLAKKARRNDKLYFTASWFPNAADGDIIAPGPIYGKVISHFGGAKVQYVNYCNPFVDSNTALAYAAFFIPELNAYTYTPTQFINDGCDDSYEPSAIGSGSIWFSVITATVSEVTTVNQNPLIFPTYEAALAYALAFIYEIRLGTKTLNQFTTADVGGGAGDK